MKLTAGRFLSEVQLLRWELKRDASTILSIMILSSLSSLLLQIAKDLLFLFH